MGLMVPGNQLSQPPAHLVPQTLTSSLRTSRMPFNGPRVLPSNKIFPPWSFPIEFPTLSHTTRKWWNFISVKSRLKSPLWTNLPPSGFLGKLFYPLLQWHPLTSFPRLLLWPLQCWSEFNFYYYWCNICTDKGWGLLHFVK